MEDAREGSVREPAEKEVHCLCGKLECKLHHRIPERAAKLEGKGGGGEGRGRRGKGEEREGGGEGRVGEEREGGGMREGRDHTTTWDARWITVHVFEDLNKALEAIRKLLYRALSFFRRCFVILGRQEPCKCMLETS